jgi:hypothetical protein
VRVAFLFGGHGRDLGRLGPDMATVGRLNPALLRLAPELVDRRPDELWERGGRALERTDVIRTLSS